MDNVRGAFGDSGVYSYLKIKYNLRTETDNEELVRVGMKTQ